MLSGIKRRDLYFAGTIYVIPTLVRLLMFIVVSMNVQNAKFESHLDI